MIRAEAVLIMEAQLAVILQFFERVHEAHVPRDHEYAPDLSGWWINPTLWKAPLTASSTSRPTEDAALQQIEMESRAIRHRHRHVSLLSADERRILELETRCINEHPAFQYPHERARWIASQLIQRDRRVGLTSLWNPFLVQEALEEISAVIADAERDHVADVVRQWDLRVIERRERERAASVETAKAA